MKRSKYEKYGNVLKTTIGIVMIICMFIGAFGVISADNAYAAKKKKAKAPAVKVATVVTPSIQFNNNYKLSFQWKAVKKVTVKIKKKKKTYTPKYQIEYKKNNGKAIKKNKAKNLRHVFINQSPGTKYTLRVRAYVKVGKKTYWGKWSNWKSKVVQAPTIIATADRYNDNWKKDKEGNHVIITITDVKFGNVKYNIEKGDFKKENIKYTIKATNLSTNKEIGNIKIGKSRIIRNVDAGVKFTVNGTIKKKGKIIAETNTCIKNVSAKHIPSVPSGVETNINENSTHTNGIYGVPDEGRNSNATALWQDGLGPSMVQYIPEKNQNKFEFWLKPGYLYSGNEMKAKLEFYNVTPDRVVNFFHNAGVNIPEQTIISFETERLNEEDQNRVYEKLTVYTTPFISDIVVKVSGVNPTNAYIREGWDSDPKTHCYHMTYYAMFMDAKPEYDVFKQMYDRGRHLWEQKVWSGRDDYNMRDKQDAIIGYLHNFIVTHDYIDITNTEKGGNKENWLPGYVNINSYTKNNGDYYYYLDYGKQKQIEKFHKPIQLTSNYKYFGAAGLSGPMDCHAWAFHFAFDFAKDIDHNLNYDTDTYIDENPTGNTGNDRQLRIRQYSDGTNPGYFNLFDNTGYFNIDYYPYSVKFIKKDFPDYVGQFTLINKPEFNEGMELYMPGYKDFNIHQYN